MAGSITIPWHRKTDKPYEASVPGAYFHKSKAPVKLFGGAVGGTKTTTLSTECLYLSLGIPNNRGFCGERDFDDLRRGLYTEIMEWLPENRKLSDGRDLYVHNKSEHWLRFYNGSEIHFVELKDEPRNVNLGWAAIDQAERVPEKSFEWMTTRLRLGYIPYRPLMMSANPEPGWLYRKMVEDARPVDTKIKRRNGDNLIVYEKDAGLFIPSFITDNVHLPEDYEAQLYNTLSPIRVERLLKGIWETVENAIYDQLDRQRHLIEAPTNMVWTRTVGGADFGSEHLSAVATVSMALDGTVWVREVWAKKTGDLEEISQQVRAQMVRYGYAGGRTDPLQDVLAQVLGWSKAKGQQGSRKDRISMVTRLLNANAFFFDARGRGTREAFEEALSYRWETKESDTRLWTEPVRKNDDRVAAIEYAVEELMLGIDYRPPNTKTIHWGEVEDKRPSRPSLTPSKPRISSAVKNAAVGYRLGR